MVTGFCLMPRDNVPPKTPIPIQTSAGTPHASLFSCFDLGWYPMFHVCYTILCPPSWSQHDKTLTRMHLPCLKLGIYIADTASQQAFQSPPKPNSATAPLIPYLERADFHSMLKSVSFLFLLQISFVSAALPSVVFLGMSLPFDFFPKTTKILRTFVSSSVWLPYPQFLSTQISVKGPYP